MSNVARALLVCGACAWAGTGWAAEVSVQLFGTSLVVSSEASTDSSAQANQPEPPPQRQAGLKQGTDGMSCEDHDDCRGWCQQGFCAGGASAPPQCTDDAACAPGQVCRQGQCQAPPTPVRRDPPPQVPMCTANEECVSPGQCVDGRCVVPQPPPDTGACTEDAQCAPGLVCDQGQCAPPASPPLLRRGRELYLRQRVVQLRQDLAVGAGPVITMLAAAQRVSAVALGKTLRAHRAELAALLGDGADDAWAGRFLERVEQLGRSCPRA